jgi:hypothetical protein
VPRRGDPGRLGQPGPAAGSGRAATSHLHLFVLNAARASDAGDEAAAGPGRQCLQHRGDLPGLVRGHRLARKWRAAGDRLTRGQLQHARLRHVSMLTGVDVPGNLTLPGYRRPSMSFGGSGVSCPARPHRR